MGKGRVQDVLVGQQPNEVESLDCSASHEQSIYAEPRGRKHAPDRCASIVSVTKAPHWVQGRMQPARMRCGEVELSSGMKNAVRLSHGFWFAFSGEVFDDIK